MADIRVIQTAAFRRAYKRLHQNQKTDVDDAVAAIVADPTLGEAKKGDLAGVFVYKFRFRNSGLLALLAYEYDPATRLLLLLGTHENFYRELKRN